MAGVADARELHTRRMVDVALVEVDLATTAMHAIKNSPTPRTSPHEFRVHAIGYLEQTIARLRQLDLSG